MNKYPNIEWIIDELNKIGYENNEIFNQKMKQSAIDSLVGMQFEFILNEKIKWIDPIFELVDDEEMISCKKKIKKVNEYDVEDMCKTAMQNRLEYGSSYSVIAIKNCQLLQQLNDNSNDDSLRRN